MLELSFAQKQAVGLQYVLDLLAPCTPFGAALIKKLRPCAPRERAKLERELDDLARVTEVWQEQQKSVAAVQHAMMHMKDVTRSVKKCGSHSLGEVELFELKNFLIHLSRLTPPLSELAEAAQLTGFSIDDCEEALDLLDPEGTRVATFHISELYSDRLREIRREKKLVDEEMRRSGGVPADALAIRRANVIAEEEREETAVRNRLSAELRPFLDTLMHDIEAIARLDLLLQKAALAVRHGAVRPQLTEGEVAFRNVVNPQVQALLASQGKRFTPVSIRLGRGATVLTGANMGGKSVALKTVTLNVVLVQMGFFAFAEEAAVPIFDSIGMVSEDLQSVEQGLSSFGAEVVRLKELLRAVRQGFAFLALDEFARGTNPEEGAIIVRAVVEYLNTQNCVAFLTTHYDGVAELARAHYQVAGLKGFDPERLRAEMAAAGGDDFAPIARHMDYSLHPVGPDEGCPREALNICRLLALDEEIIELIEKSY